MPDHEACKFIFTDNANWGKFIVRAAFALFMKVRFSAMSFHHISEVYLNSLSMFNWFESLNFHILQMPWFCTTHE
jgi:hypothetical protein